MRGVLPVVYAHGHPGEACQQKLTGARRGSRGEGHFPAQFIFSPLSVCCEMDAILMDSKWSVRKGMEILKTTDLSKYYSHNGTVTKAVDHVNISISYIDLEMEPEEKKNMISTVSHGFLMSLFLIVVFTFVNTTFMNVLFRKKD